MVTPHHLKDFPDGYRGKEIETIAGWIAARSNGSVVGLVGCGRSNLLDFLSYRPEVLRRYLPHDGAPLEVIPIDLSHLVAHDLSTLYRVILRAFYWRRERFDEDLKEQVTRLYLKYEAASDPFLPQSALYEVLFTFRAKKSRVVLVLNRFDRFCQQVTPQMLNTLRSLRDSFKDILTFIVGMRQEVIYLPDREALSDMYELLDSNVCWVGAMTDADARWVIEQATFTASIAPTEEELAQMLALTGNFPVLLKRIGKWWQKSQLPLSQWLESCRNEQSFDYRLERLWNGLTQEEQFVLSTLQMWQEKKASQSLRGQAAHTLEKHAHILSRLVPKGVCQSPEDEEGFSIRGDILAAYIKRLDAESRGRIAADQQTQELYQGVSSLRGNLSPLEDKLLRVMLKEPYKRFTKEDLIESIWSNGEADKKAVTNNNLHQLIKSLRQKIEAKSSEPRYIVTWKSYPYGGYQFFPEGRPE